MIKLEIKDPIIKTLIMEELLHQAEINSHALVRGGANGEWLRTHLGPESRDLIRANLRSTQYSDVEFTVTISEAQISHAMTRAADEKRVKHMMEYFVRHDASINLLRKMFKMGKHEVQAAKNLLSSEHKLGRPQMPAPIVRESVHQEMDKICKANPTAHIREHLYMLHQAFSQYSLATLWQVINEFGPVDAALLPTTAGPPSQHTTWQGGSCVHKESRAKTKITNA